MLRPLAANMVVVITFLVKGGHEEVEMLAGDYCPVYSDSETPQCFERGIYKCFLKGVGANFSRNDVKLRVAFVLIFTQHVGSTWVSTRTTIIFFPS